MTTAAPGHRSPAPYTHNHRHHPYAHSNSNSNVPSSRPSAPSNPKWHTANNAPPSASSSSQPSKNVEIREPPSPPRSRRDHSETPSSLGLGVAFGASSGGKWWDEELPPPPSSLSSILDSFRRSGEGDRELLLSILGAKKAEEERLTALIQTRLTILQARLSIHSAAASLSSYTPLTPPTESIPTASDKLTVTERTPSLSSSRGSFGTNAAAPISPPVGQYMPPPPVPAQLASEKVNADRHGYFHLPPPTSMVRPRSSSGSRSPMLPPREGHEYASRLPPMRMDARDVRDHPYSRPQPARGSTSPKSSGSDSSRAPGLDMLLDAGMERERRDSNGRD